MWPTSASIRYVDGSEEEMPVEPKECEDLAEHAREVLHAFNKPSRDAGLPIVEFARPESAGCRFCPYRAACRPYYDAYEPSWTPGVLSVVGIVQDRGLVQDGDEGYVGVLPLRPTTHEPVTVLGIPVDMLPSVGSHVSVLDAAVHPGRKPSTELGL